MESYAWDTDTRVSALPAVGAEVNVHEFDYRAAGGLVYEQNGVRITSFPAVHIYDGPVSLRLEWNGLTFVYSGDTTPNQFFLDHAKDADVLIHETFNTVGQLVERSGYDEKSARAIGTYIHSAPEEAGFVLNAVAPRLAVMFHFFNDFDTAPEMEAKVRENYSGPLALATDFMVINATKDEIVTRMAVVSNQVWPNKEQHEGFGSAERKEPLIMSNWLWNAQLFPKGRLKGGDEGGDANK